MALLTKNDVQSLDYSADGSPWCITTTKSTSDLGSMDYSADGSPYVIIYSEAYNKGAMLLMMLN